MERAGKKQFLVDINIGKESWNEWYEWIESVNDDLPEPEGLADVWDHMPELSPCLIDGVLRQGHKMLLSGPQQGRKILPADRVVHCDRRGETVAGLGSVPQGRVMYVNLELDPASCLHRFRDVYEALGWQPANLQNIDIWN